MSRSSERSKILGLILIILLTIAHAEAAEQPNYSGLFPIYDNDIRYRAGRILATIDDKSIIPAFIKVLDDTDNKLRFMAIDTLIKLQAKEALPHLAKLLKDPSTEIRIKALSALALLGNKKTINAVLPLIKDDDSAVRIKAKDTLKQLGYKFPKTTSTKSKKSSQKASIPEKPAKMSHKKTSYKKHKEKPNVGKLISVLKSGKDKDKISAMRKLVMLKEVSAVPVILSHINTYRSQAVHQEAIKTLSAFGAKSSIPHIIKSLGKANEKTALTAIEAVMHLDRKVSLPIILKEGLKNKNPAVRIAVARYIAKDKISQGVKVLTNLLDNENSDIREFVCSALGNLQAQQAIPYIHGMMDDEEEKVRIAAIRAFSELAHRDAVPYLIKQLDKVEIKEHIAILESMVEIGEKSSVSYLVKGLDDNESAIRTASAKGLGKLIHKNALLPLIETALVDNETNVRLAAARSLRKYNSETVGEILTDQLDNPDLAIRKTAIKLIGELSIKSAVPYLKDFFEIAEISEKRLFIESIGKIGDPSGLEIVVASLNEKDRYLKQTAISTLSSMMGKKSEPHLAGMLKDDDIRIRFKTALELSRYGNLSSHEILTWALKDEYADVRDSAERALTNLKDKSIIPALASILKDEHYKFRYFATISSNDIYGKKTAIPRLVKALDSKDPWIQYAALKALYHFKNPSAINSLHHVIEQADSLSRIMAVRTLGAIAEKAKDTRVIEPLSLALDDRKVEVRCAAVEALGKIKDTKANDLLTKMLEDPEKSVKYAAAFALAEWADPKAIPILCKALRDKDVEIRYKAAKAFYNTCNAQAIPSLESALHDKSPVVKEAASMALKKWRSK